MKNRAKILSTVTVLIVMTIPFTVSALTVGEILQGGQTSDGITAQAYLVLNVDSGQVLASRNPDQQWVPASLTKLVTAMVFLDTKPNLNRVIAMQQQDQNIGGCSVGGACISTKPGITYRLNDLLHASLIASANNATAALARSTGLSTAEFAQRMNAKVQSLGATNSSFTEPTGMDPANTTTASDYAKIMQAAFAYPTIQAIDTLPSYSFRAVNNSRYVHNLKNTDKLLADDNQYTVIGAKTGYLDEALHNFAVELRDPLGNNLVVVLLGSQNGTTEFDETRQLASLGSMMVAFGTFGQAVLGTSTTAGLQYPY